MPVICLYHLILYGHKDPGISLMGALKQKTQAVLTHCMLVYYGEHREYIDSG